MENQKVLSFMSATGKIDYNMTNNYIYLCRSYDQLYRGQKYEDALPV